MNDDATMIPCDHVIAQLWEYLDGDLAEPESEQVRRHLEMCARCFPEYDFRRAYLRFVRRCSTENVPPELRRRVFAMLLEEERKQEVAAAGAPAGGAGVLRKARETLRRLLGNGS